MLKKNKGLTQKLLITIAALLFLYACGDSGCPMNIITESLPGGTVGEEYHAELE